jgi:hypothetical protein
VQPVACLPEATGIDIDERALQTPRPSHCIQSCPTARAPASQIGTSRAQLSRQSCVRPTESTAVAVVCRCRQKGIELSQVYGAQPLHTRSILVGTPETALLYWLAQAAAPVTRRDTGLRIHHVNRVPDASALDRHFPETVERSPKRLDVGDSDDVPDRTPQRLRQGASGRRFSTAACRRRPTRLRRWRRQRGPGRRRPKCLPC